jgi:hypothetical protein
MPRIEEETHMLKIEEETNVSLNVTNFNITNI